jgi:hypothetical protein
MVLRPRVLLVIVLIVLALLAGVVALLFRHGGERLVSRQSSAASAQALRDCLGTRLGLAWQGDPRAMHASTFSLRVVVSDSGKMRQIGFFTPGSRKLSSGESTALQECAAIKP